MGRKIPGKKHKGVKDPEKQQAKRLSALQTKINAPPRYVDEQEIPKSLQRLIKLQNAAQSGALVQKKKKRKRGGSRLIKLGAQQTRQLHPKARPEKIVPIFDQRPGESNEEFYHRVSRETRAFIKESQFEAKYNVDVKRDPETGEIENVVKRPKGQQDEIEKLRAKHKNVGKKKKVKAADGTPKLSKSQKRKQKLLEKQQRKSDEAAEDFDSFKDKVEFGDIVHAPPDLKVLPRKIDKTENKVKNKNLLLNSLFRENETPKSENAKPINKSGKRKDLPIGERRQLEKQQSEVIAAYKLLKARKFGDSAMPA